MDLQAELFAQKEKSIAAAPPEVTATFVAGIQIVADSGITRTAINVGDEAPDFALPDALDNTVRLSDLLTAGPVVISFYRGGWCPYCNLELAALQRSLGDIQAAGGQLVAISPQIPDESLSTEEKGELSFPVLSDVGSEAIRRYGLVFTLDAAARAVYEKAGRDLAPINGTDTWELPLPATYVVGTNGRVAYAFVDADYRNRAPIADILGALQAL